MLICPVCHNELTKSSKSYHCINNHNYDVSKEGYLNLLSPKHNHSGDNKEMVLSREIVHQSNLYEPLASLIKEIICSLQKKEMTILDSGCGEGYYLDFLKKDLDFSGIGLDISKFAIQKAAKRNKDLFFMVSSSNDIPLANNSIDFILSIFSPWFNNEFVRILKSKGMLIIVSPGENHLIEIKNLLYTSVYLNDEKTYDLSSFKLVNTYHINYQKDVSCLSSLVKMTPYYYKTNMEKIEKLNNIKSLKTTFDFKVFVYEKEY